MRLLPVAFLSLSLVFMACGGSENDPDGSGGKTGTTTNKQKLLGSWTAPPQTSTTGSLTVMGRLTMTFEANKVTNVYACEDNLNRKLTATVSSPAEITDTEIKILESIQKEERQNDFRCAVSVAAGKFGYKIDGSSLRFVLPDQKLSDPLTRK